MMKGARAWALLAGLGLLGIGVWQVVLYAAAPNGTKEWFAYLASEPMLGKTWGARVAVLLFTIAPLRAFSERAHEGWGVAARGFLWVWLPIAFLTALLQTESIERLREWADAAAAGSEPALVAMTMWHALVEPFTRTAAVIGVLGFVFLFASTGVRGRWFALLLFVVMTVLILGWWSAVMEAVVAIVLGFLLALLAFVFPREPENPFGA